MRKKTASYNILFAGTSAFAAPSLQAIADGPHRLLAVLTKPDQKQGRGQYHAPNPIKAKATELNLPIYAATKIDDNLCTQIKALQPDLIVVASYGLIMPKQLLELPPHGCMNIHASILPKFRGASPIQQAILSGEKETGITLMRMDEGLDTGDMLATYRIPIHETDNSQNVHDRLANLASQHINGTITAWIEGKIQPEKQNENLASYAGKIQKQDGIINWTQNANTILQKIKAYNPYPLAHTCYKGKKLFIFDAAPCKKQSTQPPGTIEQITPQGITIATGNHCIQVTLFQAESRKKQHIKDTYHALPWSLKPGSNLSHSIE